MTPLSCMLACYTNNPALTYVTRQLIANGIKPFYRDTGGALNRRNNTALDKRTIDAIVAGGK